VLELDDLEDPPVDLYVHAVLELVGADHSPGRVVVRLSRWRKPGRSK
jgi:hypothetical protein